MSRNRARKIRPRRKTEVLYWEDDAPTTPMAVSPADFLDDDSEERDTVPGLSWSELNKTASN
jgi:hypothetical protein